MLWGMQALLLGAGGFFLCVTVAGVAAMTSDPHWRHEESPLLFMLCPLSIAAVFLTGAWLARSW